MKDTRKIKITTEQRQNQFSGPYNVFLFDVKDQVNQLFGGLVKRAFIELGDDIYGDSQQNRADAKQLAENIETEFKRSGRLCFDDTPLFIEFKSGAKVQISASEWAGMQAWKEES